MKVPLSRPEINRDDINAVVSVMRSPYLSTGPRVSQFECLFARYIGARHAIAVSSGTAGLHLCVRSLNIGEGDEVITTPFSFVASSNCLLFERSIPRFVDILPSTLCIDPEKVESAITSKTKAILAVDVFGHPADWDALGHLARKYGLHLIEDACESLGSKYKGKLCGTFGDCAVFAFYPNKQMTTGEGGMIVTKREEIARISRSLRNQGRSEGDQWLVHERLGYNYRLSDLSCALGISQLSRIDEILKKRSVVALYYNEILSDFGEFVSVPLVQKEAEISWFVYVVRLSDDFSQADRDEVLRILRAKGIGCSNYFPPIHVQPFYKTTFGYKPGDFPIAEAIASRTIALPFFSSLSRSNAEFVCGELREAIAKLKANRHE